MLCQTEIMVSIFSSFGFEWGSHSTPEDNWDKVGKKGKEGESWCGRWMNVQGIGEGELESFREVEQKRYESKEELKKGWRLQMGGQGFEWGGTREMDDYSNRTSRYTGTRMELKKKDWESKLGKQNIMFM